MTAEAFFNGFGNECGAYKYENLCQAYIIALGVNDLNGKLEIGDAKTARETLRPADDPTILNYYGAVIKSIKKKQPDAKIFLMTIPRNEQKEGEAVEKRDAYCEELRKFAELFENTYIIDLHKYAPVYDEKFRQTFFLGHMTATGYMFTAKLVMSYIDYYIRKYPSDFSQVGFIGTPYKYETE